MSTQVQTTQRGQVSTSIKTLVENPAYKARFNELLKDRAPQFVASLVQLVNASQQLQRCDPNSIIAAAVTAAAMDLPIEKNLGFAHIVPYGDQAQFQMGYKGFIQLAIRTGQYKFINVAEVFDGELDYHNKLTSEITLKPENKKSDKIVGYVAYFKLVNGFEHAVFWDAERVELHAKRYSKAYSKGYDTPWKTDFDKMAMKTVIKDLLSHWGILSIEMTRALTDDLAVRTLDGEVTYPDDNPAPVKAPAFDEPPAAKALEAAAASTQQPKPEAKKPATPKKANPLHNMPTQTASAEPEAEAPEGGAEPVKLDPEPEQSQPEPTKPTPPAKAEDTTADGTLGELQVAMEAAGVNEFQVITFCKQKKIHKQDGTPPEVLSDLPANKQASLTKQLLLSESPILKQIRDNPPL